MPAGTKDLIPLTGQKILNRGKDGVGVQLKYRETAVFKQFFFNAKDSNAGIGIRWNLQQVSSVRPSFLLTFGTSV